MKIFSKYIKLYFYTAIVLLYICSYSIAQSFKFQQYGIEQGISQPFVYTINQDKKGYLWVGTGEGLCKFNGKEFVTYTTQDSIAGNVITESFKDRDGDLWFGHNNGNITYYDGKRFRIFDNSDKSVTSSINDIIEDSDGNILFASQNDGIIKIKKGKEFKSTHFKSNGRFIYSICKDRNNQLLVGTNEGLFQYILRRDSLILLNQIKEIPETKIQCIVKKKFSNSYWIGTEDKGLFLLAKRNSLVKTTKIDTKNSNIQDIYEDNELYLWVSTFGNGLFKLIQSPSTFNYEIVTNFTPENGLNNSYIKQVFEDREGNLWIGTYGGGLSNLIDDFFTFYSLKKMVKNNSVFSVYCNIEHYWLGLKNELLRVNPYFSDNWKIYNSLNNLPKDKITTLYKDYNNILWIGTANNGLYRLNIQTNKILKYNLSDNYIINTINHIDGYGDHIWIGTLNGIFNINIRTNSIRHYKTNDGLPHNNIKYIYIDLNGKVWAASPSNYLSICNDKGIKKIKISSKSEVIDITSVTQDKKGDIWLCTLGNGVYTYSNDTIINITTDDGLKSNYCYGIISDELNNIWVSHHSELSKITDSGIKIYTKTSGITGEFNPNSIFKDQAGNIWFGTTNGIIKYDSKKDKVNLNPPTIDITSIKFSDNEVELSENIKMPYGTYKLKIDFIGLSFKEAEQVKYQYKLDGYDIEWSELTNINQITYNRIESGRYTFLIKAFNSDGVSNAVPYKIEIQIAPPFWKRWWFILLSIMVVIYTIITIIRIRERNHKKIQEYLRQTLYERTKEVIDQKEEIVKKNKAITDSINYAQRIQSASIPPLKKFQKYFPESFFFYLPRDIVSGDFYWYGKIKDKMIIVCADSTGHGVPGAFMSMIGTTLLKDICSRKDIESPADILYSLDKEIIIALHQEDVDGIKTSDGLDISICEIDLSTLKLKFASAMQPICLYKNNQFIHVNGNKFSIGGTNLPMAKKFENQEFQLEKGDIIYMFSDGYPDQFGGPQGKKLKIAGLEGVLHTISHKPMNAQYEAIKKHFFEWKNDNDQVDDVLLMGIKV